MNRIEKLIAELCPEGVEWKKLGEVTIWDRRFSGVGNNMQKNVISFKHISANDLKKLETTGGNIKLLSTGKFDGWTTEKLAEGYINEGEIISIPSGGSANIKYYNGKFVDSGNILATSFDSNILNLKYCYYFLLTKINLIESYFRGSGVKHPDMPSILNIPIPIPPLPIQEEIVKILDTFTALEEELEAALEAELEARKKQYEYYRNKLLTPVERNGRWYLNGVEVEWKKLGEIGFFYNGLTGKNKNDFVNGNAKYVTYMNVYSNIEIDTNIEDYVKINENEQQNRIEYGDVLFTGSSETLDECGISSVLTKHIDEPLYLNSFCFGFRLYDKSIFLPGFLKYLFRSAELRKQIVKTANGVTRFNVSKKLFAQISIPIPPLSEQERIVAILDKFDALVNDLSQGLPAEIEARRKQYEYYRNKLLNFSHR